MNSSIAGIIYRNGKFLMGRRLPGGQMGNRWEFPGGKVEPGENPEQTIVREFQEEFGVAATPGDLITTVEFTNKNGPVHLMAYRVCVPDIHNAVLTEHTELAWATMEELEQLDLVDSDRLLVPELKKWSTNATDC